MLDGAIRTFVHQYRWIHLSIGLLGNTLFVAGSVLFLFEHARTAASVCWLAASIGMLLGRVGEAFAEGINHHWKKVDGEL